MKKNGVGKSAREIADRIYFTEPWLSIRGTEKYESLKQAVERELNRVISRGEYDDACAQALEGGSRRPSPGHLAKLLSCDYETLVEMSLGDLGIFVADRTGNMRAAAIARSSAPQTRYDGVVASVLSNPRHNRAFTLEERCALAARIVGEQRRLSALRDLSELITQRERGQ